MDTPTIARNFLGDESGSEPSEVSDGEITLLAIVNLFYAI